MIPSRYKFTQNFQTLIDATASGREKEVLEVFQTSVTDNKLPTPSILLRNGLVHSIVKAYSNHHHLIIRPEDIWFAILTQFNSYVNAHSEDLREHFVTHKGKEKLVIVYDSEDRYSLDYGKFAQQMSRLLEAHVVDAELRSWIMPDFSTTTNNDRIVASILMMSTLQKYLSSGAYTMCGIPSVTLLGERADYVALLEKAQRLSRYGDEPSRFAAMLTPILTRFVASFDEFGSAEAVDLWERVLSVSGGSGVRIYTGWISAFCFWNVDGKINTYTSEEDLVLDGIRYPSIDSRRIPPGWSKVPVEINDNGAVFMTEMTAGSVGMACSSSSGGPSLDTLQPITAWWIRKTDAAPEVTPAKSTHLYYASEDYDEEYD